MSRGPARAALCAAVLSLLLAWAPALAAQTAAPEREAVSVSGVIVVDDDGSIIIQDDSGVDYLVKSPDLARYSGEGIIGEGVTWADENGDQILVLSTFEIIDIVITPQEPPAGDEKTPTCPTSQRGTTSA
jgi:hypothetical protein